MRGGKRSGPTDQRPILLLLLFPAWLGLFQLVSGIVNRQAIEQSYIGRICSWNGRSVVSKGRKINVTIDYSLCG